MTRPRSRMESMEPYYAGGGIELYHGSALDTPEKWTHATALITDPPYGISYGGKGAMRGDDSTMLRDITLLTWLSANGLEKPVAVFGSWKVPRPPQSKNRLIWHKAGRMSEHLRMSWRPTDEEIYVWGDGWARGTSAPGSVITTHENRASETRRLGHPTPKPLDLLQAHYGAPGAGGRRACGCRPIRRVRFDAGRRRGTGPQGCRRGAGRAVLRANRPPRRVFSGQW